MPPISSKANQVATFADFATVVTSKLPWFILAIVGLSFLLLVLAFRSLLIPATAAVMNLLAAAASFGVLTAFFQWGWGSDALGLGKAGPIEAFLPPITLAILFGLSMDYQVFLVSRINEEWVYGRNSRRAVRTGQTQTAGVITAAATIMICVWHWEAHTDASGQHRASAVLAGRAGAPSPGRTAGWGEEVA